MNIRVPPSTSLKSEGNTCPGTPLTQPGETNDDRINILLVDDEPKNLTVMETVLDDPNYRLIRAESADEALLALVREEFALIVLDIQMPGMTGFELAQMIKQRKKTAGVPIIFVTAYYSDAEHILEGYDAGAVDYLHKPVSPPILRSKVAVFAALHRTKRQTEIVNNRLLEEVAERQKAEEQLLQLNNELEQRVQLRTSELSNAYNLIHENEQLLRLAQEAGQVGIWSWDLRTGSGVWTATARIIFDPMSTTAEVNYSKWLSCIHPDDRDRAKRTVDEAKKTGFYRDELRVLRRGFESEWVELVGAVEFENEEPIRMRGIVRDITDRKRAELELKEVACRKDEFLATLAHELRNPLAPIRNSIQILKMPRLDAAIAQQTHEMMERQVQHLIRLVDDLMDVSRVMRGKIELRREPLELTSVIGRAMETVRPLIEARAHQVIIDVPGDSFLLYADAVRLAQVMSNLLTNATKYTEPNGHISVTARRDGDDVVVQVEDDGIGIDAEVLPHIFELFVQADHATTKSQGGLGIGLTLVKNLVEMHQGSIKAYSKGLGLGSVFELRLPLSSAPREFANRSTVEKKPSKQGAGHRLLVVDDNRDAANSLAMLLRLEGHEVRISYDGPSALEMTKSFTPEMVFLDIGMPLMDGYEVAKRMRQQFDREDIVLTALTGWGQKEDRQRTADAGFNYHLVKPVEQNALDRLLADLKPPNN